MYGFELGFYGKKKKLTENFKREGNPALDRSLSLAVS